MWESNGVRPDGMCGSRVTPWDVRLMVIFGVDDVETSRNANAAVGIIHVAIDRRVASGRAISKLTRAGPSAIEVAGLVRIRTAIWFPDARGTKTGSFHQRRNDLQRSTSVLVVASPRDERHGMASRIAGRLRHRVTA